MFREATRTLRDLDPQRLYWIDVRSATRAGGSAASVTREEVDWEKVHQDVAEWLANLDLAAAHSYKVIEVGEDVGIVFRARPRAAISRGAPEPSLTIAEQPVARFFLSSGEERSLHDLEHAEVRKLASGEMSLALALPSHRSTFEMLAKQMEHFGHANTLQMDTLTLQPYAAMLGLIESPPALGDYDTEWQHLHLPIDESP